MVTVSRHSLLERRQRARELAIECARVADEHRGEDIVILDMTHLMPIVDFFVIVTGATRRRIHTIVEEIDRAMEEAGERRLGIEGYDSSRWVLLDYGDIVVHVFDPETRRYYDLENHWADAPRVPWQPRQRPHTGAAEPGGPEAV